MLNLELARRLLEKEKLNYWDIREENTEDLTITGWNKELKGIIHNFNKGFSVRVLYGNGWGFSACTDYGKLNQTVQRAVKLAKGVNDVAEKTGITEADSYNIKKESKTKRDPKNVSLEEKRDFVLDITKKAYTYDKRVKSSIFSYREINQNKLFFNSDSLIEQNPVYIHLGANVMVSEKGRYEEQSYRNAQLGGYELTKGVEAGIDETCKKALVFLNADKAKSGKFIVLADGALTDVFVHEAVGHAAEADIVLGGDSFLTNLIGKKICSSNVSIVDDPASSFSDFGSYFYDDEGIQTQKTYIVQNGVLKTFLHNRETAYLLKAKPTGNARAESFLCRPLVRMSNTYMEKGKGSFSDMLSQIKNGYLLKGSKGGQVNPGKGSFHFSSKEAYLIKNGEIIKPVRAVSITGNALDILKNIISIGNKYEKSFPGFCVKNGQSVFINGKNPSVLIKQALLS